MSFAPQVSRIDPEAPLVLDAGDVLYLRKRACVTKDSRADVHFDVCPTCAAPVWRETRHEGTGLTVAKLGGCCQSCRAFEHRHPEVFAFVVRMSQAERVVSRMLARVDVDVEMQKEEEFER